MTPYDAVMVGVVVAGMIWGAIRGMTWQLASLASLVLGYAGAMTLSSPIAPHLPGQPIIARALSMLIAYVLISAGIFGAAWVIRATLRRLKFEAYDRHLGMLLGGLEGALLGTVLTLFALSLAPSTRTPILGSPSGRVVSGLLSAVEPVLPGEMRAELGPLWSSVAEKPSASDEWDDLKQPLDWPGRDRRPADVAATPREVRAEGPSPTETVSSAEENPATALESDESASLGRVVADTIDSGLGKVGDQAGRAPDSRRRRIGRVLGDILGNEIDRMGSRRDDARKR